MSDAPIQIEGMGPFAVTLNLDEQAAHLLRRAHQRASAIFTSLLGDHQITPTQFFALARLREMGQVSQNHLGRLAAMDPATIQGVIQRLGERGYIDRRPDPSDRRRMLLALTAAGDELTQLLLDGAHAVEEAVLAPLEPHEREAFANLIKKLI